jgi:hypothetical protein
MESYVKKFRRVVSTSNYPVYYFEVQFRPSKDLRTNDEVRIGPDSRATRSILRSICVPVNERCEL